MIYARRVMTFFPFLYTYAKVICDPVSSSLFTQLSMLALHIHVSIQPRARYEYVQLSNMNVRIKLCLLMCLYVSS